MLSALCRSRLHKGTAKKNKSLPPLQKKLAAVQNPPSLKQKLLSSTQESFQASPKRDVKALKQSPPKQSHQASSKQNLSSRVVLKPHFASVAESTPCTGSFPSRFWVVEGNGVCYPRVPNKNMERVSWKAVLEDAGKVDGYRKIHADKMKRMKEEV